MSCQHKPQAVKSSFQTWRSIYNIVKYIVKNKEQFKEDIRNCLNFRKKLGRDENISKIGRQQRQRLTSDIDNVDQTELFMVDIDGRRRRLENLSLVNIDAWKTFK